MWERSLRSRHSGGGLGWIGCKCRGRRWHKLTASGHVHEDKLIWIVPCAIGSFFHRVTVQGPSTLLQGNFDNFIHTYVIVNNKCKPLPSFIFYVTFIKHSDLPSFEVGMLNHSEKYTVNY